MLEDASLPALPDITQDAPWPTLSVPTADRPQLGNGATYWLVTPQTDSDTLTEPHMLQLRTLPHQSARPVEAGNIAVYGAEVDGSPGRPSVIIGAVPELTNSLPVPYHAEQQIAPPPPITASPPAPTFVPNLLPEPWARDNSPRHWNRVRGYRSFWWLFVPLLSLGSISLLGWIIAILHNVNPNPGDVGSTIFATVILVAILSRRFLPRRFNRRTIVIAAFIGGWLALALLNFIYLLHR